MTFFRTVLGLATAAFFINADAVAQSSGRYSLTWSTIDGGGGSCAGGVYSINGTVGQPDASAAPGGAYRLAGGFWPGIQGLLRPTLYIAASGPSVIISWAASANGFYLQHCADLAQSNWVSNSTPAFLFGSDKVVVESAANVRLYRLTAQ